MVVTMGASTTPARFYGRKVIHHQCNFRWFSDNNIERRAGYRSVNSDFGGVWSLKVQPCPMKHNLVAS